MRNKLRPLLVLSAFAAIPGTVRSQDTILVIADNAPVWGTNLSLTQEVRVGTLDGPAEAAFGQLMGVVVGPGGEIVVADWQGPSVRVFSAEGAFLRDLGRPGQGPGEFRQVLGIQALPSGDVAVWDPGNQRISTFGLDGSFRGSVRAYSGFFTSDPFRVDSAGVFYVKALRAGARLRMGVEPEKVWLKIAPDGTLLDSLAIPMPRQSGVSATMTSPAGARKPFTREFISTRSPMGYEVRGHTGRLAFERTLRDGRILRVTRRSASVAVGSAERAQWQEWLEYVVKRGGGGLGIVTPVPSSKPAFREIWVDQDGRVWLSRYVPANYRPKTPEELAERKGVPPIEWVEPPTWDVFDARGTFLGTLLTPERGVPVAATGRHVWFIEQGEYRESYVTRYRMDGIQGQPGNPAFP